MELSKQQKLITLLLCDIHKALEIKHSLNAELVNNAIRTGNDWALNMEFEGPTVIPEETVRYVANVLEMWSFIEEGYSKLDGDEKALLEKEAPIFGKHVSFSGFDGNKETSYMSVANFFIKEMNRYQNFAGRDLNSHVPNVDTYQRMLDEFEPIKKDLMHFRPLKVDNLIRLLQAKVHPDQR